jgi:hypothetical protein
VTFVITVTDPGAPLSNVTITSTAPQVFAVQGATGSSGATVTTSGQTVTAQIASMPAGGTTTVTIETVVQAGQYGAFTNTATATGPGIDLSATAQVAIPSLPDTGYGYGAQLHERSIPWAGAGLGAVGLLLGVVAVWWWNRSRRA